MGARKPDPHPFAVALERLGVRAERAVHVGDDPMCDEAGALAAVKHSRCQVVTAGMDRMTFLERVEVGELLVLKAAVNAVWRTSMEVGVRVMAERPRTGESRHTNTAYLTFVALDDEGRPTAVAPLHIDPDDIEGRRREQDAQLRRRNRLAERDEIRAARESGA